MRAGNETLLQNLLVIKLGVLDRVFDTYSVAEPVIQIISAVLSDGRVISVLFTTVREISPAVSSKGIDKLLMVSVEFV